MLVVARGGSPASWNLGKRGRRKVKTFSFRNLTVRRSHASPRRRHRNCFMMNVMFLSGCISILMIGLQNMCKFAHKNRDHEDDMFVFFLENGVVID